MVMAEDDVLFCQVTGIREQRDRTFRQFFTCIRQQLPDVLSQCGFAAGEQEVVDTS